MTTIGLLVPWRAGIASLFLVSVHVWPVARIAFGVIFLPVALLAVVFARRGADWALRSFLRGDPLRVAMVVKVKPIRGIEVQSGRVDGIEFLNEGVEVLFGFE